jgi:hypothetical protein
VMFQQIATVNRDATIYRQWSDLGHTGSWPPIKSAIRRFQHGRRSRMAARLTVEDVCVDRSI